MKIIRITTYAETEGEVPHFLEVERALATLGLTCRDTDVDVLEWDE